VARDGTFSIFDWSGYPSFLPRPAGPFRLLQDETYRTARRAANKANEALRSANPATYEGKHVHENQPVKFGGDPTDASNKITLSPSDHYMANGWWYRLQRYIEKINRK
jgi:hypothetical protein